jgi:sulfoxide reductase catalytic subunit YedY
MTKKRFTPSVTLKESDVTDESVFRNRRQILKSMGYIGASSLLAASGGAHAQLLDFFKKKPAKPKPSNYLPLTYTESTDTSQTLSIKYRPTTIFMSLALIKVHRLNMRMK